MGLACGMDIALLDTSFISNRWMPDRPGHRRATQWFDDQPPGDEQRMSVITLGEFELGIALMSAVKGSIPTNIANTVKRAAELRLIEITKHTASAYAEVKSRIALRFMPRRIRENSRNRLKFPEDWIDETNGSSLQISENDLWICAQAIEHNLRLVTFDCGMQRAADACPELRLELLQS